MISHAELIAVLYYNRKRGVFTWRVSRGTKKAGSRAGSLDEGYRRIRIFGKAYRANRLAYFYVYGQWPKLLVDHADRKRDDDRIEKLREANASTNSANATRHRDNRSGFKGVIHRKPYNKWRARIVVQGKEIHLGTFDNPRAAHRAYVMAAKKYFGEFARAA